MVAAIPSASPASWRPATRTLGAVFAGSAVMFAVAVVQGGSVLPLTSGEAGSAVPVTGPAEADIPQANTTNPAAQRLPATSGPAGQAAPWAPGAAPEWGAPLSQLPVHRAPVQSVPAPAAATPQTPGAVSGAAEAAPAPAVPAPEAGADTGRSGAAPAEQDGLFGGLVTGVRDLAKGLGL